MTFTNVANGLHSSTAKKKMFKMRVRLSQRFKRGVKPKSLKKRFICEKCDKRFLKWWMIRDHWRSTGHKCPEQCLWCKKKTFALQSHLCKQHWNLATMCPYCGQLFMYRENQKRHVLCHNGSEYRCFQCGRRRKNEELLRSHVFSHYLHEKYGCNVCEKRFKKKKNMETHLKRVHFICQYCGKMSDSKEEYKKHLKLHDDLKCVLCKKVFSQKNRLKYHYQLQHGHQDFYKCSICFQRFALKGNLLDHIKLKHNGISNFSCKICARPFLYWKNYLNHFETVHVKTSEDDKTFLCSFCDFRTEVKVKLQWHVEKTSGIGFFCKKCQLRLECKGTFDIHMKTHVGEHVWTCDYCTRSYSSDDTLKHHMSIAHKEVIMSHNPRGYPCPDESCDRYYTVKNSLTRHIRRVHSGNISSISESPTGCRSSLMENSSSCKKRRVEMNLKNKLRVKYPEPTTLCSTSEGGHFMVSQRDTTEVNVYYCDSCEKFWFTGESQFTRHMSTHKQQVWEEDCGDCNMSLVSPEEAVKHYVEDHFKVKFQSQVNEIEK